jgi:histidinol dehydrogenase
MNATASAAGIARLSTRDDTFDQRLDALLDWAGVSDQAVQTRVAEILEGVKTRGDAAVIEATNRFDHLSVSTMQELTLTPARLEQAYNGLPGGQRDALTAAAERIRRYH